MSFACCPYVTRMYSYVIRISLICTLMSFVCHSYVLVCHTYVTRTYSYVIRMSLICTRMSSVCHSYVLACHPCFTRMYSYAIRMPLVCTHMSSYVTRMYSHVIRMSLICTPMSSVCHWYLVLPWTKFKYYITFLAQNNAASKKWQIRQSIYIHLTKAISTQTISSMCFYRVCFNHFIISTINVNIGIYFPDILHKRMQIWKSKGFLFKFTIIILNVEK